MLAKTCWFALQSYLMAGVVSLFVATLISLYSLWINKNGITHKV